MSMCIFVFLSCISGQERRCYNLCYTYDTCIILLYLSVGSHGRWRELYENWKCYAQVLMIIVRPIGIKSNFSVKKLMFSNLLVLYIFMNKSHPLCVFWYFIDIVWSSLFLAVKYFIVLFIYLSLLFIPSSTASEETEQLQLVSCRLISSGLSPCQEVRMAETDRGGEIFISEIPLLFSCMLWL